MLRYSRVIVAHPPPGARTALTINKVRLLVPTSCLNPGLDSAAVPNVKFLMRNAHLPGSSRSSSQALTVLKWYWTQLKWAQQVDPLCRVATWFELYLDFVCATSGKVIGSSHSTRTKLNDAKGLFVAFP